MQWKDIMEQCLHMDKQIQEKLIQCLVYFIIFQKKKKKNQFNLNDLGNDQEPGIIPRSVDDVFTYIKQVKNMIIFKIIFFF